MARMHLRQAVLLSLLSGMVLLALFGGPWLGSIPEEVLTHPFWNYSPEVQEVQDPQQVCLIPRVHPLDQSIWRYWKPSKPILCKARQPFLTYVDSIGNLYLNQTALSLASYSRITCSYQPILRKDSDDAFDFGEPVLVTGYPVPIPHDFISVTCRNFLGISIYSNIHPIIRSKPLLGLRGHPSDAHQQESSSSHHHHNVLIFALDSISRLAMMRHLPKTYQYLVDVMGATVFRGMNKIGDNTFPNVIAILTGKEPYVEVQHPYGTNKTFDDWPLIWKNFSDLGYQTFFAEDFPKFGLFNYLANGFRDVPTDFYFRPFWLAAESSTLIRSSSNLCFGGIPKHKIQMQYLKDFLVNTWQKSQPYFAFSFLVEISHEYLEQVSAADDDFVSFLRDVYEGGYLNNTLFFFLSDHGHRFDSIRKTAIGRLEERLPFYGLRIPDNLYHASPHVDANLQVNAGRLTTPYDTFETLSDFLWFVRTGNLSTEPPSSKYGKSLFKPIPPNRTCMEAGIPMQYCACEHERVLDTGSEVVRSAAFKVIDHLNSLIKSQLHDVDSRRCAVLSLGGVVSAQELVSTSSDVNEPPLQDVKKLRVIVKAEPSKALFEGLLLRKNGSAFEVVDDISRINRYGSQSSCIKHEILRKYCFCV